VNRQAATGWPQQPLLPCRSGASVCKEVHPLEKCEQFKKMSWEQRVVKVNQLQLCLICLKHSAERECYAKGKPTSRGVARMGAWSCTGPS
jgi:hypothetical protein